MDRKRRLMENNNGWPLRSQLFDGAPFRLPLLNTAVPASAATGTTATFTRATAKTWPNNDGYLVTGVAGEIGFVGARRVDNLIRLGAAQSSTLAVAASVTMTLPAGAYQFSMGAGTGTATFSGTGGATGTLAASASARTFVAKTISAGTLIVTASVATLVDIQVVSMVAETDQTTPREYVSVGVVQRNLQFYSNVFSNALWNNEGNRSVLTANAGTAPSGAPAYSIIPTADNNAHRVYNISLTAPANIDTTISYKAKSVGGYNVSIMDSGGGYQVDFDLTLGTAINSISTDLVDSSITDLGDGWYFLTATINPSVGTNFPIAFAVTNASKTLSYVGNTTSGILVAEYQCERSSSATEYQAVGGSYIYHGSFVDGIKCFTTDLSGNPIPSTTLLGYQAEGARTNLCLQSNALATTPWADQVGTCTPTQNATGPDGAVSAWTLTDNDGAATEVYGANVGGLTAASYTTSIFVAKTSGAQSSYPVVLMYDGTALRLSAATIDTTNGIATIWTSYTGWTAVGTADCVSYNDDFWRVSLTFTASTNAWVINLAPAGALTATLAGPAYNATAQGSAVFYGAQVELGSFASSYIPTTTIAVARNADVLTYPSAGNVSGTTGWCYAEAAPYVISSGNQVILGANGVNRAPIYQLATTGYLASYDGTSAPNLVSTSFTANIANKVAATWGGILQQGAKNGVVGASTAFDGNYDLTDISVGINNGSTNSYFGTIRNVRIGQRQLSASELQAITA